MLRTGLFLAFLAFARAECPHENAELLPWSDGASWESGEVKPKLILIQDNPLNSNPASRRQGRGCHHNAHSVGHHH